MGWIAIFSPHFSDTQRAFLHSTFFYSFFFHHPKVLCFWWAFFSLHTGTAAADGLSAFDPFFASAKAFNCVLISASFSTLTNKQIHISCWHVECLNTHTHTPNCLQMHNGTHKYWLQVVNSTSFDSSNRSFIHSFILSQGLSRVSSAAILGMCDSGLWSWKFNMTQDIMTVVLLPPAVQLSPPPHEWAVIYGTQKRSLGTDLIKSQNSCTNQ